MSDPLSENLREEKFNELYLYYLHNLLLYIEIDSVQNQINFYESLIEVAKAKPTPHFIDQKIARLRALRRGDSNEWSSLSKEIHEGCVEEKLLNIFKRVSKNKFEEKQ